MPRRHFDIELRLQLEKFNKNVESAVDRLDKVAKSSERISNSMNRAFAQKQGPTEFQKRVNSLFQSTEKVRKSLDKVEASGDFKKQARRVSTLKDEVNYLEQAIKRYGNNNTEALQLARRNLADAKKRLDALNTSTDRAVRNEKEHAEMLRRVERDMKGVMREYRKMEQLEKGMGEVGRMDFSKMGLQDLRHAQSTINRTSKALREMRHEIPSKEFDRMNAKLNRTQKELNQFRHRTQAASRATHEYSSVMDMWWQRFGAVAIGFTVAYRAMNAFENVLYSTVDLMKEAIFASGELSALQAEIATYYTLSTGKIEDFNIAMENAAGHVHELAQASTRSATTIDELVTGFSELAQHGIILPRKMMDEYAAFNDLLVQVAKSTGNNIKQIRSEWGGMLEGQMRAQMAMIRMLKNIGVLSEQDIKELKAVGDKTEIVYKMLDKTGEAAKRMQEEMLKRNVEQGLKNWRAAMQQSIVYAQRTAASIASLGKEGETVGNIFGEVLIKHINRLNEELYKEEPQKHFINLLRMIRTGMDKVLTAVEGLVLGIAKMATVLKNAYPYLATYLKAWLSFEAAVLSTKVFKVFGAGFKWMHKEVLKVTRVLTVLSSSLIAIPALVYTITLVFRTLARIVENRLEPWFTWFRDIWGDIKTAAHDALSWIINKLASFKPESETAKRALESLLYLPAGTFDLLPDKIDETVNKFKDFAAETPGAVKEVFDVMLEIAKEDLDKFQKLIGPVFDALSAKQQELFKKMLDTSDIKLPSGKDIDKSDFFKNLVPEKAGEEAEDQAKKITAAYKQMYTDLGHEAEGYFQFFSDNLKKQAKEFENLTGDAALANKWLINQLDELYGFAEDKAKDTADTIEEAFTGWANNFSRQLNDLLWDADVTFKQIAESFGKMITQIVMQKNVAEPLVDIIGNIDWGTIFEGAKGGVISQGEVIHKYARGGVVDTPTIFPMAQGAGLMGEEGEEGILPLSRNRSGDLGVSAEGLGMNLNVEIHNYSSSNVSVQEGEDEKGQKSLEIMIDEAVAGKVNQRGSATNRALRTGHKTRTPLIKR